MRGPEGLCALDEPAFREAGAGNGGFSLRGAPWRCTPVFGVPQS